MRKELQLSPGNTYVDSRYKVLHNRLEKGPAKALLTDDAVVLARVKRSHIAMLADHGTVQKPQKDLGYGL